MLKMGSLLINMALAMAPMVGISMSEDHKDHLIQAVTRQAETLDKSVLKKAIKAYEEAQEDGLARSPLLTIVDYGKPSYEPRLWVVDVKRKKVLYEEYVSHGSGSGDVYAKNFSNKPESHQSSIGVFVTQKPYYGKNGYSLRVEGLEEDVNDLAKERGIVVHGGDYVREEYIERYGKAGRSHGCFVVSDRVNRQLINTIQDGSVIYVYSPKRSWFSRLFG